MQQIFDFFNVSFFIVLYKCLRFSCYFLFWSVMYRTSHFKCWFKASLRHNHSHSPNTLFFF